MVDGTSLRRAGCEALVALLGTNHVFLPGSAGYNTSIASYFSPQAAAVRPACYVTPQTAQDVSAIVKSLTSSANGGPHDFAVRAGGHTWFADSNSSPGGVTVDLRGLKSVDLSADKSSVSVGSGATWDLVYGKLDPLGLSVAGGRVAGVGVGGLTLGGGISYFSPREGWTCNQALAFEVVLADGSIVEANESENADLWWGLRGGSNNLGIVTRIDLRTFEQGLLWYSMTFNPLTVVDEQIKIYADLMAPQNYDVNASYLTGWAYAATQGLSVTLNQLIYTQPTGNVTPAYFKPILDLPSIPTPISGTVYGTMSTLAAQSATMQVPQAAQYMTATVTFEPTEAMIRETYAAFNASLAQVQNVTGVSWAMNMEPLPPQIYNGGGGADANALGLTHENGRALVVCLISPSWSDAAQNDQVYAAARALMDDVAARAKKLGVFDPYIYLNYAAPWQDVIPSYGAESVEKLQKVRARVDPGQVFTKKVTGGFKIPPSC
ncbi:putative oxidoreductase [Nemania diffusa]|nr:putative oxidoreductase [Nemania diffusa]